MEKKHFEQFARDIFGHVAFAPFLEKAWHRLRKREQDALYYKFVLNAKLDKMGELLGGVTKERARQIKVKALEKLTLFSNEEARAANSKVGAITS